MLRVKIDKLLIQFLDISYVPLVDVAVGAQRHPNDAALVLGKKMDIFCFSPKDGKRFRGDVWPVNNIINHNHKQGPSYFPDFFHPDCPEFWG